MRLILSVVHASGCCEAQNTKASVAGVCLTRLSLPLPSLHELVSPPPPPPAFTSWNATIACRLVALACLPACATALNQLRATTGVCYNFEHTKYLPSERPDGERGGFRPGTNDMGRCCISRAEERRVSR